MDDVVVGLLVRICSCFQNSAIKVLISFPFIISAFHFVSWTLQSVVALSTTEAEYIALTEAIKEGVWLNGILNDFGIEQKATRVLCDNNSAICLAKYQIFHERSKHIDVRLHYIRDQIEKNEVEVLKVGTEDNAADPLTKAVPHLKLKHCLELVSVLPH